LNNSENNPVKRDKERNGRKGELEAVLKSNPHTSIIF
jgi:hypothetical protein